MRKLLFIFIALFSQSVVNCTGTQDRDQELILVHFASSLEGATIRHDGDEKLFYVIHEDREVAVQNCFVDTFIRNCTTRYLVSFIANGGYLIVKQFDDGEVYIKAKMRLNGGGTLVPEGHWFQRLIIACFDLPHVEYCPEKKEVVRKKPLPGFSGIPSEDGHFNLSTQLLLNDLKCVEVKRIASQEKADAEITNVKTDEKCLIGPGIPISRLPISIPGTRPPILKMPKEIVRQPGPILPGKITLV